MNCNRQHILATIISLVVALALGCTPAAFAAQPVDQQTQPSPNLLTAQVAVDGQVDIADAAVSMDPAYAYSGRPITPSFSVTYDGAALVPDIDFQYSYSSNVRVGTATLTLRGMDAYTGEKIVNFKISKRSLSEATVSKPSPRIYTGKAIKLLPKITLGGRTLKKGIDYSVSYESNKNAGTAKIIMAGKGNYKGKKSVTFKIKRRSLSKARISKISSKEYTGEAISPVPTVRVNGNKLKNGRDFAASYSSNKNPGTAKVKVKGIGNYTGSKTATFKIDKPVAAPQNENSSSGIVYWTPSGSVYHYSGSCPTLSRSRTIYSGSISASGKPRGCYVCG